MRHRDAMTNRTTKEQIDRTFRRAQELSRTPTYLPMTTCTYQGCSRHAVSRGLCSGHRSQRDRGVELYALGSRHGQLGAIISVRLRPETAAALRQLSTDPLSQLCRRLLEAATGTGSSEPTPCP